MRCNTYNFLKLIVQQVIFLGLFQELEMTWVEFGSIQKFDFSSINKDKEDRVTDKVNAVDLLV